ncbi:hypothetical protein BGZ76_002942 [Entomortierella beljakovae]|nr:hypothetical protein BGZ76_002942 [Entomortierella beljakovae]
MSPSTPRRRTKLVLLILILTILLCISSVHAQEDPEPTEEFPTSTPSPIEFPSPSSSPSPSPIASEFPTVSIPPATATGTAPAPTSTAVVPDPIFSQSTHCIACKAQYHAIKGCSARIPFSSNLTLINQVLPFYQCVCPNDGALIDSLQQCSVCLRSSGQLAYLNPAFYEVTNQDVKSMKQVCNETQNGTLVPSGSIGRWSSFSWGLLSVMMFTFSTFLVEE